MSPFREDGILGEFPLGTAEDPWNFTSHESMSNIAIVILKGIWKIPFPRLSSITVSKWLGPGPDLL